MDSLLWLYSPLLDTLLDRYTIAFGPNEMDRWYSWRLYCSVILMVVVDTVFE